jgi:hypothetical protein
MKTKDITGFVRPSTLAATYTKYNGEIGVSRAFIYQLIKREREQPNSTDIEVLDMDGLPFVRQIK